MYFSSKISNAFLVFLDEKSADLGFLYEGFETPEEFLRDPSYWLEAQKMERFLELASATYRKSSHDLKFMEEVGHANPQLRCWGVLDSVLRMMAKPEEILIQPQRFLSYFISPEPPIENLKKMDDSVSFDLPVSSEQYPMTTAYLRAAFESLPVYVQGPQAQATWDGIHISASWTSSEVSQTLGPEDPGHLISSDLMQSIIESMEKQQKELEEKNRVLLLKNEQLEQVRKNLEHHVEGTPVTQQEWGELLNPSTQLLKQQFQRLQDYLIRAQQLITILIGQDRMSSEVKEAMRRVDWEYVKEQFPVCVEEGIEALQKMKTVTERISRDQIDQTSLANLNLENTMNTENTANTRSHHV